jgi:two-component system, NtrC family, sensor kinase
MNNFPVPFKFIAVALLTAVLLFIGIRNLGDRAAWINPSDGIFWTEENGRLKAEEVTLEGPGNVAGIQKGDLLVSIDDRPIFDLGLYSEILYGSSPGSFHDYKISGASGISVAQVSLGSQSLFTAKDGLKTLLAFFYLGIGIFVLWRGNRQSHTLHFYFLCLAACVLWLFSYTPKLSLLDLFVYVLSGIAFLLLPALFWHFCARFPIDKKAKSRPAFLFYIPFFLLALIHGLLMTGHLVSLGLPRTAHASNILDRVELFFFCIGFLGGSLMLLRRRIHSEDLIVHQQVKWISYGTLAGIIPFSLAYLMPVLLGFRANFTMESSILFLAFIPLAIGYALVRYRLMDVDTIARRGAAYFIASSLLLAAYLLFVLVLGKALQWIAPRADFLAVCLIVLVIALIFAPLRNAIQTRLDRLFYRDQFEDRSTLLDFARMLSSEISLEPLSHSILDRISKTFPMDRIALFISDPLHPGFLRPVTALHCELPLHSNLYRDDELTDGVNPDGLIGLKAESGSLYCAGAAFAKDGFQYLQDLRIRERRIGVLALGALPNGSYFTSEDISMLSALAGYAAIALENAVLYHSVESKARELELLKAYTENIVESIDIAVLALEGSGRIRSCNHAFETLFNIPRSQIAGTSIEKLLSPDIIVSIQRATGTIGWKLDSPANIFKLSMDDPDSKKRIVNLSVIPLQDPSAADSGSLLVIEDITEKIYLEDQLLQTEKLSSIGLLAAGIAHEINTPIAGISSYTQMLLKESIEPGRRKSILEKIEKQTFRAAEIVNSLLNFSRLSGSEFNAVDINQLISDSLALLDHQLGLNHIKVASDFEGSLPPIYGNTGKLQQVFVNLFLNARDAMPLGGELAIRTGMNESMIIVDISDTGYGISKEHLKKIFDPFFTTKSIGKGTGLGLAVTYGIIQEHGGKIFVDSDTGRGTRFTLKLPTRLH